jgi:hypothetical protein
VTLTKYSEAVLEAMLLLAERQELISNKKVSDVRQIVAKIITDLDELITRDEGSELEMNWAETVYFSFRETEWPEIQLDGEAFLVPRFRQIVVPGPDNAGSS